MKPYNALTLTLDQLAEALYGDVHHSAGLAEVLLNHRSEHRADLKLLFEQVTERGLALVTLVRVGEYNKRGEVSTLAHSTEPSSTEPSSTGPSE